MSNTARASEIIDVPLAVAWEKLQDFSAAHYYVPGLIDTKIVSDDVRGIGASRYVYRTPKRYVQETIEQWHEGSGFIMRLHKGDKPAAPFKDAWFEYQLEEEDPKRTRFNASLTYELPGGPLGQWVGRRLRPSIDKVLADVATAMKLYYESGEPTTPERLKAYKRSL